MSSGNRLSDNHDLTLPFTCDVVLNTSSRKMERVILKENRINCYLCHAMPAKLILSFHSAVPLHL